MLAVARAGAGTNNIPVAKLSQRGIPVFNAPGANANAVKELVLAGMFLAARNICQAWGYVRALEGDDHALEASGREGQEEVRRATNCRAVRSASSGSAPSASKSPTPRSACA